MINFQDDEKCERERNRMENKNQSERTDFQDDGVVIENLADEYV